ncbi:MAG TPA: response regulator [Marmoricola sp.]|nr:response regulator [Marmoricola sp.]
MISVLLVDDEPAIRTILATVLHLHGGFEVVGETATGDDAARLAADLRPDVIVLDLGLPDLAPRHVLATMRRASPTSKVVVYTGNDSDRAWFEQRAEGYVAKDADLEDLLGVLEEVGEQQAHDLAILELPPDLQAPREARAVIRELLAHWGYRELIEDAVLVVSELVANSVEHAEPASVVVADRGEGVLRIEVRDHGEGHPVSPPESGSAERGRGLMIVSALARSWGVLATERSKTVWVELGQPATP